MSQERQEALVGAIGAGGTKVGLPVPLRGMGPPSCSTVSPACIPVAKSGSGAGMMGPVITAKEQAI